MGAGAPTFGAAFSSDNHPFRSPESKYENAFENFRRHNSLSDSHRTAGRRIGVRPGRLSHEFARIPAALAGIARLRDQSLGVYIFHAKNSIAFAKSSTLSLMVFSQIASLPAVARTGIETSCRCFSAGAKVRSESHPAGST
jgi:hypothetical protein